MDDKQDNKPATEDNGDEQAVKIFSLSTCSHCKS